MFIVSGGTQTGSDYLDSTEIFDPDLGTWRSGAALPSPRDSLRAASIANRVLIFGLDVYTYLSLLTIIDMIYLQAVMTV